MLSPDSHPPLDVDSMKESMLPLENGLCECHFSTREDGSHLQSFVPGSLGVTLWLSREAQGGVSNSALNIIEQVLSPILIEEAPLL